MCIRDRICSVQTGKKQIAYTFELSGTQTGKGQAEQMLQILQQQEIPATFFEMCIRDRGSGVCLTDYPPQIQQFSTPVFSEPVHRQKRFLQDRLRQ